MVKEDDLGVFVTLNFLSDCAIARVFKIRIDVDDLSVSLVSEEESSVGVGIHSEVRGIIDGAGLSLPVVVAEVRWHRQ